MDSDNVLATDGLEVAHQNGSYVQTPAPGGAYEVVENVNVTAGISNETASPNGNAKVVAQLDDGLSNDLSTGKAEEESVDHAESNGLTIAKVGGACFLWLVFMIV